MEVVLAQVLEEEEDMIIIQEIAALIIEILVKVIVIEEVVQPCPSLTTPEIIDNMVEEIQGVVEEDFQEVGQEETILYLEARKLTEIIEEAAHHREAIIKVVMGNMVQVEAIFHGLPVQVPLMGEVVHQVIVDQEDVDHLVVVDQRDAVNHYLEMVLVQATVECKTLPIGAEVALVLLDLLYSVNPQI